MDFKKKDHAPSADKNVKKKKNEIRKKKENMY